MLWQLGFIFSDSVEGESGGIGWGIIAFAVVLVVMALMPRIIRKIRRERIALQQQETKNIRNAPNIRSQADKILVDLAEMSREISAQVDVKIRVLNKLIRDSEEVVSRYEKLVERAEKIDLSAVNTEYNSIPATDKGAGSKPVEAVKTLQVEESPEPLIMQSEIGAEPLKPQPQEEIISLSTYAKDVQSTDSSINRLEIDNSAQVSEDSAAASGESGSWQETIQAKVARMHREGRDVTEIAGKTRLSIAEINLILSILEHK